MGWRAGFLLTVVSAVLHGELLPIRTYITADGLPSDHINCIVPDSRGFLWICTPEGLARFDGYQFVKYGLPDGLPHQMVSTVLETRDGNLFVGTARGMARVSGTGTRLAVYAPDRDPASAAHQVRNIGASARTHRHPECVAEVAYHLPGVHSSPERLGLGPQRVDSRNHLFGNSRIRQESAHQ
jgi:hypothetical protein